jgi:carbon storage regulator
VLILQRKVNERIRIDKDVVLVIVEVRGDRVKIGFTAPTSVKIHREEVYEAIRRAAARGELSQLEDQFDAEENFATRPSEADMISPVECRCNQCGGKEGD